MAISRAQRAVVAAGLAADHGGVAHRRDLRRLGVDGDDVRSELRAGRWARAGRHTVVVTGSRPEGLGLWWRAVWESGSGAALDGVSALQAVGLTGFETSLIDISVPRSSRARAVDGVRIRRCREIGRVVGAGLPRVVPDLATIHAAQWAVSDRQAALLVCLAVQQRIVAPPRLLLAWRGVSRSSRRRLLDAVISDVCDGAHSLGELDFAKLCRRRGLPLPTRQVVRSGPRGRIFLDVAWELHRLVVEVDGAHHGLGLAPVDDALRANEVALGSQRVLRIPVLGLRLDPDAFMNQVARGLTTPGMQFWSPATRTV